MALETLAHEAHHLTEQYGNGEGGLPRGRKVDPQQHAQSKAVKGAITGALMYAGIAVAAAFLVGFAAPNLLALVGPTFGLEAAGATLAQAMTNTTTIASYIGLPALGGLIKGMTGYAHGKKEAEQHNARLEGRAPAHGRGRGHEVEAGAVIAGVPGLAQEEAYHPAQDQRGSFVERYRPDGPVTGAERIAAMVEAERAARSEQAV